jgi:hypothetical protein
MRPGWPKDVNRGGHRTVFVVIPFALQGVRETASLPYLLKFPA